MGDRAIMDSIRTLSGVKDDQVTMVAAEVVSVDIDTRTCKVTTTGGDDTIEIDSVRIMASVDDGVLIIPAVGSTVLVSYSTYNQPFISLFSAVDKVLIITGDSTIEIIDGKIKFNDGSFGGLVKVIELTEKLNNLENLVNDLITKYNTHTHAGVQSGGSVTAVPSVPEPQTLTPTQRGDIENDLIEHGRN